MRELFGTDGIRGKAGEAPIDQKTIKGVAGAYTRYLKDKVGKVPTLIIGKDTRESSLDVELWLVEGITSAGGNAMLAGFITTPGTAYLTKNTDADGSIMISASHNPWQDNGIKLFDGDGYKLPDEVELRIESMVGDKNEGAPGQIKYCAENTEAYIEMLKGSIEHDIKGMKLILDCANGAAYKIAPKVFKEMGAEVIVLNDAPDGKNINEDCGALHPEKVGEMIKKVGADLGVTLDGDADRLILVDENGEVVDGDATLALSALYLKKTSKLNSDTIVVTDYSNMGLDDLMKANSIRVIRTKNGDRYVMEAMLNGGFNLGGEKSGHLIFHDKTTTGDGIIAACEIINILKSEGKKLSELAGVLKRYPQVMLNVDVTEKKDLDEIEGLNEMLEGFEKELSDSGRIMIRYSGTQNVCRVMVEGKDADRIKKMAEDLAGILGV